MLMPGSGGAQLQSSSLANRTSAPRHPIWGSHANAL